jgi:hypothetical protein
VRHCASSRYEDKIIVAGIGAPLFARELGGIDLTQEMGDVTDALPAFAVKEIALRDRVFPMGIW